MDYRTLGRTGVQVSRICFGTMSFGGDADEATAAAMFRRCREAGVNFFDCADVYNAGRAEEILGRLIADCRDEVIITSKVHFPTGPDVNAAGLSRRHILLAVEASLRRLKTDRIDVYFLHGFDAQTPIEESLRALDDLVHQGKILYPAVSNWAAWQTAKGLGISAGQNLARFECLQPMYSLVKRQAEVEILPLALFEGLGVISYSPLGAGLLTGKFAKSPYFWGVTARPERARLTENRLYMARYSDPLYFEVAERFTAYARNLGFHPATLAIAWVMAYPAITAPIVGARNPDQLEPLLASLDVRMSAEWRAEISGLSPEPVPATDRSEERLGVKYQGALVK
jgi:aryl-alcohol dehydrogenase-like predicted oxidoreductase